MRYFKYILCLTLTLLLAFPAMASDAGGGKPNASAIVLGHIKDSYEWHVTDIGEKHIIINLPVIVKSSTGWHVFSSAKFTEEADANGYRKGPFNLAIATKGAHAGKIVELNGKAEVVPFDISITKTVACLFIDAIILRYNNVSFLAQTDQFKIYCISTGSHCDYFILTEKLSQRTAIFSIS